MDLKFVSDDIRYNYDRREAPLILAENILDTVVQRYDCCSFWTVAVSGLAVREKDFFHDFMPGAKTAVVVGHHVVTRGEWQWYATANGGEHCAADDHTRHVCLQLKEALVSQGFPTEVVPYPEVSGLQFRFVAQSAGAGEIAKNAFLLHPQWGPWIHLRVLATRAPTKVKPSDVTSVCNDCGVCVSACPAGAIQDKTFDGLRCRHHRKAKGEYIPVGPMREFRWCEICADVCPIGTKPTE
jgi:epoxyqueuosine reductase